ncbi:hypothetical protein ACFWC4_18955, partial [Streptomyces sp. NPDC060077]
MTAPPATGGTTPAEPADDTPPGETMSRTGPTDRALLPTATGAETLAALRAMLRGHRPLTVTAVGVLIAGTAIGLLTAPLLGHVVDLVVERRGTDALLVPMVLLVAVAGGGRGAPPGRRARGGPRGGGGEGGGAGRGGVGAGGGGGG